MRGLFYKVVYTIIISIGITISIPSTVLSNISYKILNTQVGVNQNKVWSIKFNSPIDINKFKKNGIRVLDSNGDEVNTHLYYCEDTKSIEVRALLPYKKGSKYTLIVDKISSELGSDITKPIRMDFIINDHILDESYINEDALNTNTLTNSYKLIEESTYEIVDIITVNSDGYSDYNITYNIGDLSDSPYQYEEDLEVYGEGAKIVTTADGAKQAVASGKINTGETKQYKVIRKIRSNGIKYNVDLSNTSSDYSSFLQYNKYINPQNRIESNNPLISMKAKELFEGIYNPYLKAKKVFEFVNSHITYDVENGNKGALSALNTGKGVCEEYADLFVALLRAGGVPARVVSGYWIEPNGFNEGEADGNLYRHAWPEFYLPDYGWIVAEPTFTYTMNGNKIVNYDYFANLSFPDHIIQGYYDNDNEVSSVSWMYYGNSPNIKRETYIRKVK